MVPIVELFLNKMENMESVEDQAPRTHSRRGRSEENITAVSKSVDDNCERCRM